MGWLKAVTRLESPNYDCRENEACIDLLVIHCISLPPGKYGGRFVEQFFLNELDSSSHPYFKTIAGVRVSAHFFIKRTGELVQFVSMRKRAWHAGESSWCGKKKCNDYSIGIELEGLDTDVFTKEQYSALVLLTKQIQRKYPKITSDRIVGHSDIAPNRKIDPGAFFDWAFYKSKLKT